MAQATWEDFLELKRCFPHAPAWGQASSEGGGEEENVTDLDDYSEEHDNEQGTTSYQQGTRVSRRKRQPCDQYPADEWVS